MQKRGQAYSRDCSTKMNSQPKGRCGLWGGGWSFPAAPVYLSVCRKDW